MSKPPAMRAGMKKCDTCPSMGWEQWKCVGCDRSVCEGCVTHKTVGTLVWANVCKDCRDGTSDYKACSGSNCTNTGLPCAKCKAIICAACAAKIEDNVRLCDSCTRKPPPVYEEIEPEQLGARPVDTVYPCKADGTSTTPFYRNVRAWNCVHPCGLPATKRCVRCKSQAYCSKEHQLRDWPAHKLACRAHA